MGARGAIGLRTRLFLVVLGLLGLSVLVAYGYAQRETRMQARNSIKADLVVRLHLLKASAELMGSPVEHPDEWDSFADRMAESADARVSIITLAGEVVGDSMLSLERLPRLDDHSRRPEVVRAIAGDVGQAERFSDTTQRDMIYAAAPIVRQGTAIGIVRVALPSARVDSALSALNDVLVAAAVLALSVSLLVAFLVVQMFSGRVRALTDAAQQMADGDLQVSAEVPGSGELAQLSRALDSLARNLSTTLADLKKQRDRMSGILSSMEEGVLFLDEAGRVALVNPALRSMLLLSGDPTGRSLLEVVRHAELKEMVDAAIEDDEDEVVDGTVQGEIHLAGLRPRRLLVRIKKLEGETEGETEGVVGVFMDVTETRTLENLRREFVANVSHELRTPVTSIRSAAETLSMDVLPPEPMVRKFLGIIDRNAARLHSLVEDLLDLSRIESRQFSLTMGPLDPIAVIQHLISLFDERARKVGLELVLLPSAIEGQIRADRRAIEHVLSNLVDNAIKYGASGERVELEARSAAEQVEIRVRDYGPGIDKRHLPRLFERFYRIDTGRSRDLGGTGLGLSIVKHLVESMSGSISVESELGVGTTFIVRLPLVAASRRNPPSLSPPAG